MREIMRQTEAERGLTAFARERFGEHLSSFLLAGCGEDRKLRSRGFVLKLEYDGGAEGHLFLKVTADGDVGEDSFLPRRNEPLVLLALIRMFVDGGGSPRRKVSYQRDEILRSLGWELTNGSQAAVDEAVARYYMVSYQPVESMEQLKGEAPVARVQKQRLVIGYEFVDESEDGGPPTRRTQNEVDFDPAFAGQLKDGLLFDINWRRIRSLTSFPVSCRS